MNNNLIETNKDFLEKSIEIFLEEAKKNNLEFSDLANILAKLSINISNLSEKEKMFWYGYTQVIYALIKSR